MFKNFSIGFLLVVALLINIIHARGAQAACACSSCTEYTTITDSDSYQVLDSYSCPDNSKVPGFNTVSLLSGDRKSVFEYHVVDEENYELAMQGKSFTELMGSGKSRYSCVGMYDVDVRVSSPTSKVYLLAKANNGTVIFFDSPHKCFVAPATSIQVSYDQNGKTDRIYTGSEVTINFDFVNQFSEIDTWQDGKLIDQSDQDNTISINNGKGSFTEQFTTPQKKSMIFDYSPRSDEKNSNITTIKFDMNIVTMATKFTVEQPTTNPSPYETFKVPFKSLDSDGIISPTLFYKNFKFQVLNLADETTFDYLNCKFPSNSTSGEGSLNCVSQAVGKFSISILFERASGNDELLTTFNIEIVNSNQPNTLTISSLEIASIVISSVSLLVAVISVSILICMVVKIKGKSGYSPMN